MRSPNLERAASYRTAAAIARRTGWAHTDVPLADALPADAPFADAPFVDAAPEPTAPLALTRPALRLVVDDESRIARRDLDMVNDGGADPSPPERADR